MATLQDILAAILNPNGSQQARPPVMGGGAPAQVGDGNNPALLQAQMARFAQPQQQAMPPQAPQGQPMPKNAPQPAPVANGGGLGGLGGILQNIIAPQSAQKNKTVGWLTSQGLDPGTATILASDKTALRSYIMQKSQGGGATEFDQRAQAAQQYGLDPASPEGRNFILSGNLPEARGGAAELGLQPQTGVDKDGNPVLIQIGKDGNAVQTKMPAGVTLSKTPIKLDAGTQWILLDPVTRQPVGQIPKDLAGAASDTAYGKSQGDARASYASMQSKLPGLETVVSQLDELANKATYTGAGQLLDYGRKELGLSPRDAAVARTTYISTVSNQILPLLRDTFGAQFTAREGDTLVATMGDPDKTPAEKQAALKAFIEQKKRDIESLARQTGQSPSDGGGDGWKDLGGGVRIRKVD